MSKNKKIINYRFVSSSFCYGLKPVIEKRRRTWFWLISFELDWCSGVVWCWLFEFLEEIISIWSRIPARPPLHHHCRLYAMAIIARLLADWLRRADPTRTATDSGRLASRWAPLLAASGHAPSYRMWCGRIPAGTAKRLLRRVQIAFERLVVISWSLGIS